VVTEKKRGIFSRVSGWIGNIVKAIRVLINIVFLVILVVLLYSVLGQDIKPLPEKGALVLQPSGVLVEERTFSDPITQLMQQSQPYDAETPIRDLIQALDYAKADPKITGVVLDLNHLAGGGISKMAEVAKAITSFKESGKPITAVADSYDQQQYYLASYADEIVVNPMGGVLITGFGYYGSYFAEAADKLKIKFHVFRAGQFKSAVEPFTRNSMSEQAKENALSWIGELWHQYTADIESQRQLAPGEIENFANNLPQRLAAHQGDLATLALESGLVDKIASRPDIREQLIGQYGKMEDSFSQVHHKTYLLHKRLPSLEQQPPEAVTGNVGVIVASGTILDGEQMEGAIGGDSLSRLIRQARNDDSLKALVLRVDSPGGSAFASDLIRQELLRTQQKMPVIISMGSLAASGGYWISAQADEIWAQPTTITGSIGVFGIIPTVEDSMAALGITNDGVGTTKLADYNQLDRPLSEEAGALIDLSIKNIYQQFLNLVATGRDSTPEQINTVAQGRVWTGKQALNIGLVDKLGTLDDAIASAALKAGVSTKNVKYVTRPLGFQEQVLKQLAGGSAKLIAPLQSALPFVPQLEHYQKQIKRIQQLNDPEHAYLQCFGCAPL